MEDRALEDSLYLSIHYDEVDAVARLIETGMDLNDKNRFDELPVMTAAKLGRTKCMKVSVGMYEGEDMALMRSANAVAVGRKGRSQCRLLRWQDTTHVGSAAWTKWRS